MGPMAMSKWLPAAALFGCFAVCSRNASGVVDSKQPSCPPSSKTFTVAPHGGGLMAPAPHGGLMAPAPRGGLMAPAPRGGLMAPAPHGGLMAPAPTATDSASRSSVGPVADLAPAWGWVMLGSDVGCFTALSYLLLLLFDGRLGRCHLSRKVMRRCAKDCLPRLKPQYDPKPPTTLNIYFDRL